MNTKENKMGQMPMLKLIISMSIPSMFSMLIQALYNIVDGIFISHYSLQGLEAVNLAFPFQMFLVAVSVGTAIGVNSLVARRLGAKNYNEANSAATNGMFLTVCSWVLFVVLGLIAVKPFVSLMGASGTVAKGTETYLTIVMVASLGLFIQVCAEKLLQATGNMIYPMIFQLIGAVTNIILDPVFIFKLDMGVAGAATATVLGQIIAAVFSLFVIFFKKHEIRVSFKAFKPDFKIIGEIYKVGAPAIVMQSIGSVLTSALNALLLAIGSGTAVNVFGIYFKLQSFVFMPVFGLNQGVMPVMGYSYGAKNKKRLMSALKIGVVIAAIIMFLGTVLFMSVPKLLLSVFNADEEIYRMGIPALRTISLCFLPAAVGIIVSTLFQAVGNGIYSMVVSIVRQLAFLLPIAYILSAIIGVNGVWLAFPLAELAGLITSLILFKKTYTLSIKTLK